MTLWRKTRTEMAGAYRSLRYDLARRDQTSPATAAESDYTSTGMSTFGSNLDPTRSEDLTESPFRPLRRTAAVAAFGTLAVAGAAGSYFAVVNGLGALIADQQTQPDPYPLAITDTDREAASNAGMGQGTATTPGKAATPAHAATAPATTPAARVPAPKTTQPAPPKPAAPRTKPAKPGPSPNEDCDCSNPPVPTPTSVPTSAPTSPAPTSEPASPTPTGSSPEPGPSRDTPMSPSHPHRR